MIIKLSRYRAPFTEPHQDGVHFISLDDQADMSRGIYDAHIRLYRSLPQTRTIDVFDPLSNRHYVLDVKPATPRPYAVESVAIDKAEVKFLDDLFYCSKIKAAHLRVLSIRHPFISSTDFQPSPDTGNYSAKTLKKRTKKNLLIDSLLKLKK